VIRTWSMTNQQFLPKPTFGNIPTNGVVCSVYDTCEMARNCVAHRRQNNGRWLLVMRLSLTVYFLFCFLRNKMEEIKSCMALVLHFHMSVINSGKVCALCWILRNCLHVELYDVIIHALLISNKSLPDFGTFQVIFLTIRTMLYHILSKLGTNSLPCLSLTTCYITWPHYGRLSRGENELMGFRS